MAIQLKQETNFKNSSWWKMHVDPYSNYQKKIATNTLLNQKVASKKGKMDFYSDLLFQAKFYSLSYAVRSCNSVIIYGMKNNKMIPVDVQTCDNRWCPNCRAVKYARQARTVERVITKAIKKYSNSRFLEVTVAPKNTRDYKSLKKTVKNMNASISKVAGYKGIKEFVKGYVRSDEIPLSVDDKRYSYNNHVNILFLMDKSFFSGRNYLSKKRWKQRFKQAMKLDYLPQIFMEQIKETKNTDGSIVTMLSNTKKRATYDMKENQLVETINNNPQLEKNDSQKKIIYDYYWGLKGSQNVSYSGVLNEIKQEIEAIDNIKNNQTKDKTKIEAYYKYEYIRDIKEFRLVSVSNYNPLHLNKDVDRALKNKVPIHKKIRDDTYKNKYGFGFYKVF